MDSHGATPYDYYVNTHPSSRERNQKYFRANFHRDQVTSGARGIRKRLAKRLKRARTPVWVVISKPQYMDATESYAAKIGRIEFRRRIEEDHLILRVAGKRK
jgi:hypothetical protein